MPSPSRSRRRVPLSLDALEGRSLMCSTDLFYALQAALLAQTGGQPDPVTEQPAAAVAPAPAAVPAAPATDPPATAPDQAVATPGVPASVTSPPINPTVIAPAVSAAAALPVVPVQASQPVSRDLMKVSGRVFNDVDRDGVRDAGEVGLKGVRVYLDLNNDGRRNINEPTRSTDAAGTYTFSGLAAGTYSVREVLPTGWRSSLATPGVLTVTPALGPTVTGANFGNYKGTPTPAPPPVVSTEAVPPPALVPPPGPAPSLAFGPLPSAG